jgi:galactose mutarotase-like enzyme
MSVQLESTRINGWDAVVLTNDSMELVVLPELGGKLLSLKSRATGRNWLWQNPFLQLRRPPANVNGYGQYDFGGWDEVFPTVDPCRVPNSAWSSRPLTDHGELWCRPWQILEAQCVRDESASLAMCVDDPDLPCYFERTLTLSAGYGMLTTDYKLDNRSAAPMPFIWAAHLLIAIEPGDLVHLPTGTRITSTASVNVEFPPDRNSFAWPSATLANGKHIDFSVMPNTNAGYAAKLFAENLTQGSVEIEHTRSAERLKIEFDPTIIPYIGMWMNFAAWAGTGTRQYFNAGIEPTSCNGDNLEQAFLQGLAPVLQPGDTRRWKMSAALSP